MSTSRIKTIETDIFSQLESPANDFLANTAGLVVEKIICNESNILDNGNQIHNFTCQYHITGMGFQDTQIKLVSKDNMIDLEAAVNAAIAALNTVPRPVNILDIQRWDFFLDNGNKVYSACIIYNPAQYPTGVVKIKIIEKDDINELEKKVNDFLLTPITLISIGVIRNEIILANGNKSYICTIPYTP